ncbi:MAG: DNA-formamidopyrimidine glycosylase [Patescibacteria group bacterium]|nr:DNA-formamidopyrimidine glycosylase [Patescibacteria group bacterium]
MPELPEVETIIRDLNKEILTRKIQDIWTDFPKMIKLPKNFEQFKKEIKGKKIEKIWRRGKNIIFELTETRPLSTYYLLIHQKLTGHLLLGKWRREKNQWQSEIKGSLTDDPMNRFLHLIFFLDDGRQLALSDLRKFAKVELLNQEELKKELSPLGVEPLEKNFSFEKFKKILPKKGKIKQVLMDQEVIAGIGNIYSDEILWQARVHPFKDVSELKEAELKKIYQAIREILPKAIELGGESISDFRRISGERGYFDKERKVYRRQGEKCSRCATKIERIKLAGRSAHFCPKCQAKI